MANKRTEGALEGQVKLIVHAESGITAEQELRRVEGGTEIHLRIKSKSEKASAENLKRWELAKREILDEAKKRGVVPGGFVVAKNAGMSQVHDIDLADGYLGYLSSWIESLDEVFANTRHQKLVLGYFIEGMKFCHLMTAAGANGNLGKAAIAGLALQKSGVEGAARLNGETNNDLRSECQGIMDDICLRHSDITNTKAWEMTREVTGRKKETMVRHGVTCPIPPSRGPMRKTTP